VIPPLYLDQAIVKVEKAALGHFHTLIIEQETKMLYAFGEDSRGQVSAQRTNIHPSICETKLTIPLGVERTDRFVDIAAGLYHSAAVTMDGYILTFGDPRYGVTATATDSSECTRWRPEDGSHIVQVACGHRHTIALDEHGRVWAMGENNFSQLGRSPKEAEERRWHTPHLVQGPLGEKGSGCIRILCGWSHTLAVVSDSSSSIQVLGWGR
jgi:alpha-tubulin suppressor-like RCC1 family protein